MLDATDDHEVGRAHRDLARARRRSRERAGAHPVDREPRDGVGQAGEKRDVAAERQTLVAHLCGRRQDDVADVLGRYRGIAAQELPHDLDRHVVGSGLPEESGRAGLPEGRANTVDEHHLT